MAPCESPANAVHPPAVVCGGNLNRYSLNVSGNRGILELQSYNFDICFLDVTSFHPTLGHCYEGPETCTLKQTAITRTAYTVSMVDSTKFGQWNACYICPPNSVDAVITDDGMRQEQVGILPVAWRNCLLRTCNNSRTQRRIG